MAITAAALLFAHQIAGGGAPGSGTILSFAAAILLVAGFYVVNDIDDRETDRVNRPERPIPSGAITVGVARGLAAFLFALAAGAEIAAGGEALAWIATWAALLTLYELRVKRYGLAANLLVSGVASSALLFGAAAGGDAAAGAVPALFAFLLHLGREVLKDLADMPGDRAAGRSTFPIRCGARRALLVAGAAVAVLVLLSPVPFFAGLYDKVYLAVTILFVDAVLVAGAVHLFRRRDAAAAGRFSRLLKSEMCIAMAAIYLGTLGIG